MPDAYEVAKLAAIREVKGRLHDVHACSGFGYGFIEGFRAGWDAGRPESDGGDWLDLTPVGATAESGAHRDQ